MEVQKGTTNEIIVRGDRRLFAQMIVIAETRKLTMSSVLSHPLGPLPWALASPDGSLRKTNNSTLANYPRKIYHRLKPTQTHQRASLMACPWSKGSKETIRHLLK